jgi:hypothetical protein
MIVLQTATEAVFLKTTIFYFKVKIFLRKCTKSYLKGFELAVLMLYFTL